ncbi:MAG: response regulator transcription factor [Verrucomicrobiota bacterium]
MSDLINVLIVEDNKSYAYTLREMIHDAQDMVWAGTFPRGEDCVETLKADSKLNPHVILLDLHLPGRDGSAFIPVFKQLRPAAEIIVVTQDDNYLNTLEAIRLGAAGYILKDVSVTAIWNAVREVYQGGHIIDPHLSRLVLRALTGDETQVDNPLSTREHQVLEQLAMGHVKKEIASNLNLSQHTINRYTENVYKKLRVSNVAAAVATAIRKGLI